MLFRYKVTLNLRTVCRAYFKQDLQLHKAWQSATSQCNNFTFYTAHSILQLHKLWSTAH